MQKESLLNNTEIGDRFWKDILKYAKGDHTGDWSLNRILLIQRCKNEIREAILELNEMKSAILDNFQLFKSFVYNKFLKQIEDDIKTDFTKKACFDVFINLLKNKQFFNELKFLLRNPSKTRK